KTLLTLALLLPVCVSAQDYNMISSKEGAFKISSLISTSDNTTRTVTQLTKEDGSIANVVNPELTVLSSIKRNNEDMYVVIGAGTMQSFLVNASNGDCMESKEIPIKESAFSLCGMHIEIKMQDK
ncbi:hypothetical protein LMH73_028425, partial [Vibrio splendidus]